VGQATFQNGFAGFNSFWQKIGVKSLERVAGCGLQVIDYWFLIIDYWLLLIIGYWLLDIGYWSLTFN
jgi:hypothetical protein